ncbi:putative tail assembly protein [Escherichia coli]|nr:putative tail assembly protein [Escherichia coli]
MILGGVAQMLAPKAKTPDYRATDNGRQNTYFSSLDNMIAQGNPMPVPYGEMLVGPDVSQDISTRDEGGGGKVVVMAAGVKRIKNPAVIADRNCGRDED